MNALTVIQPTASKDCREIEELTATTEMSSTAIIISWSNTFHGKGHHASYVGLQTTDRSDENL